MDSRLRHELCKSLASYRGPGTRPLRKPGNQEKEGRTIDLTFFFRSWIPGFLSGVFLRVPWSADDFFPTPFDRRDIKKPNSPGIQAYKAIMRRAESLGWRRLSRATFYVSRRRTFAGAGNRGRRTSSKRVNSCGEAVSCVSGTDRAWKKSLHPENQAVSAPHDGQTRGWPPPSSVRSFSFRISPAVSPSYLSAPSGL